MRHFRSLNFITGLTFVVGGFLFKIFYRPYSYSVDLSDLGFADSAPSFFYVAGFSLLLSAHRMFNTHLIIGFVTMGSILYEYYQCGDGKDLDTSDIVYSVLGGIIALLAHRFITLWEVSERDRNIQ